jgi:hypothetical protein
LRLERLEWRPWQSEGVSKGSCSLLLRRRHGRLLSARHVCAAVLRGDPL